MKNTRISRRDLFRLFTPREAPAGASCGEMREKREGQTIVAPGKSTCGSSATENSAHETVSVFQGVLPVELQGEWLQAELKRLGYEPSALSAAEQERIILDYMAARRPGA